MVDESQRFNWQLNTNKYNHTARKMDFKYALTISSTEMNRINIK